MISCQYYSLKNLNSFLNKDQLKAFDEWMSNLPLSNKNKVLISFGVYILITFVIVVINSIAICVLHKKNEKYGTKQDDTTQLFSQELEYQKKYNDLKEKTEKEYNEINKKYESCYGEWCGLIEFSKITSKDMNNSNCCISKTHYNSLKNLNEYYKSYKNRENNI